MGSAGEEPYKDNIDGSVGSLLWVRRRNGSWWPGRILSLDELPEGCLPTHRSGTPVKLLGREDASVDWYNLEKSKRIKPFRCGEYDSCIEKAKASASHVSRKAVKYARREDAILHALELENTRLGGDFTDLATTHDKESLPSEQSEENTRVNSSSSEEDTDSDTELSQSVVSFEEPKKHVDEIKEIRINLRRTSNDSEDEGVKRMRGLEDLGVSVRSSMGRKRSKVGQVQEFLKRKNRRRTLSKVLECTPMVCVPVASGRFSSSTGLEFIESCKMNSSGVMNNINSHSTNGVSCKNGMSLDVCGDGDNVLLGLNAKENEFSSEVGVCEEDGSCEKLFDVPLVTEDKQQTADEEPDKNGSTSSATADIRNNIITTTLEKNTCKWQLKGKRNFRPRKIDIHDEIETPADRVAGPLILDVKSRPIKEIRTEEFRGWSWNMRGSESDVAEPHRSLPYSQSRFSSDFSLSRRTNNGGAALYEVDVEVQTGCRSQHVPYISLMSKLNGKPVAGHPISIEVLDDGFLEGLGPECYTDSSEMEYENLCSLSEQRPRVHKSSKRKSSKSMRNRLSSSKKIRKLSSLTGSRRQSQHKMKPVLENLKGPSIACVPLKVVFSRINASLNSSIRRT